MSFDVKESVPIPLGPCRTGACLLAMGLALAMGPLAVSAETWVWIDDEGLTHFTDDPARVPDGPLLPGTGGGALQGLWADGLTGPEPSTPPGSSGGEKERATRILVSAVADLESGEEARAGAAFRSVLRLSPARPEAHWYLAWIDRRRGRYDQAAEHLRSFITLAGPELEDWRLTARARLAQLEDEKQLADASQLRGPLEWVAAQSPHFQIQIDQALDGRSADFTRRAMVDLERARSTVAEYMGVTPAEPLGVLFYGRAAYDRAHAHRFNFRTVGFFDGKIHVAAQAHPSSSLGPLLFHEYAHAVFRERTGGDRPYWLNEGLALEVERRASQSPSLSRSERAHVRSRLESGDWIPLRSLSAGFSALSDARARDAYLQSVLVVDWIMSRTGPEERARMLDLLGEGFSADQVLSAAVGLSVTQVEAAVWEELRSEFPPMEVLTP
ncbi:MAG: DUF4124 domain-containing protein [Myxococcota bacterium]|nr:DUF4124 domain-containing protein [Myxococcota bacterium]